jgi:hypothetical protein
MNNLPARIAVSLLLASALRADIIAEEPPDAGGRISTANLIIGPPGENITQIRGRIGSGSDLWGFYIAVPSLFSARALNCAACDLENPQLFLLDANGYGVYANDDRSGTNLLPLLPAGHASGPQVPGLYYLGISSYDRDARSVDGRIFPNSPPTAVHGPTGPGGGQPLSGYTGGAGESSGRYRIALTGASAVPEPGTVLTVSAALALGWIRRRGSTRAG